MNCAEAFCQLSSAYIKWSSIISQICLWNNQKRYSPSHSCTDIGYIGSVSSALLPPLYHPLCPTVGSHVFCKRFIGTKYCLKTNSFFFLHLSCSFNWSIKSADLLVSELMCISILTSTWMLQSSGNSVTSTSSRLKYIHYVLDNITLIKSCQAIFNM